MTQTEHINILFQIAKTNVDKGDFIAKRARGAYIAAVCRPDLTFRLSHASQIVSPDQAAANQLNECIVLANESPSDGLKFIKIDNSSA